MSKSATQNLKSIGLLLVLLIIGTACKKDNDNPINPAGDKGDYSVTVKYDLIRIYHGGGGLYLFSISPNSEFEGDVELSLEADTLLHASLLKSKLTASDTVGEIILLPSGILPDKNYTIKLKLKHNGLTKYITFRANSYTWADNREDASMKLNLFKTWIQNNKPEFLTIFDSPDLLYATYPETLIVEHYTYLSDLYEVRLCYHVTVPQDSWTKLLVRKRGHWQPEFALAIMDGLHVLPMDTEQYPTLYGY